MLIIHREGAARQEGSVRITDGLGHTWFINPAAELRYMTGIRFTRQSSITSFANGLMAAGHEVLMDYRFAGEQARIVRLERRRMAVEVFWFMGLAFGCDCWTDLQKALATYVVPNMRLTVFEHTAKHYFAAPRFTWDRVELHIP